MRGTVSPKVMAMMIRNAVAPLAAMLVSRSAGALGPIETNSARPVAALNRKKPGISETTAEKATAAKGRCRRSTTGVTMTLTSRQATSAPLAAFVPATEISAQRDHADRHRERQQTPRHREESAKGGDGASCCNHVDDQGHGWRWSGYREVCADRREPEEAAGTDQEHDDAGIRQARDSQRDARASEVDTTVEDMRTGDQHHAGTETDQRCCIR